MLRELKARLEQSQSSQGDHSRLIERELGELELATSRLYEAVEKGLLPLDDTLTARAQKLKARREALMIDLAGVRRSKEMPASMLTQAHVEALGTALRARPQAGERGFPKRYLRQFVSDIRYGGKRLTMSGQHPRPGPWRPDMEPGTRREPWPAPRRLQGLPRCGDDRLAHGEATGNLECSALAHADKFVRPGARRVDSTAAVDGLDTVAFRNADDGSIALIVCNSAPDVRRMSVRVGRQPFAYDMSRESIATFLWKP